MDKDMLDDNNQKNDMVNNEHNEETVKDEHKTDDIYSDYPKEVVQLLMNSNPLRNRDQQSKTLKADETKEERFSKTRVQKAGARFNDNIDQNVSEKSVLKEQKENTDKENNEDEEIFVPQLDDDIDDIAQTVKKEGKKQKENNKDKKDDFSFDDDVELVQVIRHKSPKKEYKRNFPINNNKSESKEKINPEEKENKLSKKEEEFEKELGKELKNELEKDKLDNLNKPDKPLNNKEDKSEFDDIKKKFADEKRIKRKKAILNARKQNHAAHMGELESRKKSYKNKADLNDFFEAPRRNAGPRSEKKEKLDKGILIVCGVVVVIIVVLFVRNLMLSARLEEAEQKVVDYTQLQENNEELKLEIVSLQEKLTDNGISLTDESQDETGGETGTETGTDSEGTTEYDTYTVVAGDTLSDISNKVYGNYSGYKKILEANGLAENANLQIGQVLKIPKN